MVEPNKSDWLSEWKFQPIIRATSTRAGRTSNDAGEVRAPHGGNSGECESFDERTRQNEPAVRTGWWAGWGGMFIEFVVM